MVFQNQFVPAQDIAGLHARPGFVASHGARAHFHPPNGLFGGIIRPGNVVFMLECAILLPTLTQAQDHIPQLLKGRERGFGWYLIADVVMLLPRTLAEELLALRLEARYRSVLYCDLFQDKPPFFRDGLSDLSQSFAYPAAGMELAHLMAELQPLCSHPIGEKIVRHDQADP